ncbi:MAG: phosphoglucomutase/phosphomannomutase family protein, partial [Bacteroidetes bacterium]|nr:phosphoglucomutase/phosphomannomutase family protein [Bacteroidota bacterium]
MRYPIAFGTDGWRALIGEGFTIENLERVTAATIAWLRASQEGDLTVVVGYDTRFGGERFATHVARQLADAGIRVILSDGVCPTPAVSWVAKARKASVGIMITAS